MHVERYNKLNEALDQILHALKTQYDPEKVILFGSMATGNVGEWSDLDLAIIKDTPLHFVERSVEVALLCQAPVGVDYLVYTPYEFAEMTADHNPFITEEIIEKGKVVYERQNTEAVVGQGDGRSHSRASGS
jgi:predicted nucleotidyltransferase